MNSTNTNVGGWKDSAMRTYANGEFFDKLPSDLQNAIIETKVISGHGSSESENLTTNDKIYLLAAKEINITNASDSAKDLTRVLDHYVNKVNSDRIKKYNIEMPIVNTVYDILYNNLEPKEAVKRLMTREKKSE